MFARKQKHMSYEDFVHNYLDILEEDFPFNCGIDVIGNFDDISLATAKEYSDYLVRYLKDLLKKDLSENGIVVCSINQPMVPVWAPILSKVGFKLVSKGVNHNDYNRNPIFLWSIELHKTKRSGMK